MTGPVETGMAIARRLASEAIWHGRCCNWVGPRPGPGGDGRVVIASLSPDLHAGTAGVGLVLGEAAALTSDEECGRAARGALRQALSAVERVPLRYARGLYRGAAGIALAAVRVGLLLDVPDLLAGGRALAGNLGEHQWAGGSADLVDGRAGAIVGLLAVGAALGEPEPTATAVEVGHAFIDQADARGSWTWPPDEAGTGLLATGFAHGASGAAWALLELWAATGVGRFRSAAERAWRGEHERFDPGAGNWPLAREAHGADPPPGPWVSEVAWCHGAPGVAMARHRAWTLAGDESAAADAAVALETTAAWTRAAIRSGRGSFCLCHGTAGNAEVASDCADAAGERAPALALVADEVAAAGVAEYGAPGRPWPCGWPGGESPGLMTGLAGIARFYLRRHAPGLPSLLRPAPSQGWSDGP